MKVLFLTKYTRKGASSRLRTFQYLPFLESAGLKITVSPFFQDEYLEQVYSTRKHNKWLALQSFIRRLRVLTTVRRYDKIVIEKELFPYFPAFFEWLLSTFGIQYIVDYDDAIFHNYDLSTNPLVRGLLKNKIRTVVQKAALVTAGNAYLKNKFTEFGARQVILIPTVIDITRYNRQPKNRAEPFTIGWIGSPVTFKYLGKLKPVFEDLSSRFEFRISYIGSNSTLGLPNETTVAWNEAREAEEIARFDVGIMPLEDNIWERGKCGYKLIQYMGCSIPVVGTPIGVNASLIINGHNGYQATTLEQWTQALKMILENAPETNTEMGRRGRELVEREYSLQKYSEVWLHILKESLA